VCPCVGSVICVSPVPTGWVLRSQPVGTGDTQITETKKQTHNTGARANNTRIQRSVFSCVGVFRLRLSARRHALAVRVHSEVQPQRAILGRGGGNGRGTPCTPSCRGGGRWLRLRRCLRGATGRYIYLYTYICIYIYIYIEREREREATGVGRRARLRVAAAGDGCGCGAVLGARLVMNIHAYREIESERRREREGNPYMRRAWDAAHVCASLLRAMAAAAAQSWGRGW